jgi:hypothetical protein
MNKAIGIFFLVVIGIIILIVQYSDYTINNTPRIIYKKKLLNNYNGFILPPFAIYIKESERNNLALHQHELEHWKQYQNEGMSFLINYGIFSKKYGYDRNPYEINARLVENGYCKLNYTECVRNGMSKTAYNPEFRT